ncbi:MAG TPA: phenylacetate--CoA ligase [Acidobacteriota bacterium]|nr:phenylacetate--CoA ligase [Acidobacteriota bacterium]
MTTRTAGGGEFAEIERLGREQLRRLQNQRLVKVVERVAEQVEFYRERFRQAGLEPGDIRSVNDLALLPCTCKDDLRQHYPFGLFALPPAQIARIHCSSGTTGKPTVSGYSRADLELLGEVAARSLAAAGARPGMTLHNAYGYGLFTGGLGLHAGAERLGLTVVPVSGGMTERQMTLIEDFTPEVLCCTPSYALTLTERFAAKGRSGQDLSLKFAVLGAEPWSETVRRQVDEGLGIRSTNCYGLSEVIGPGVSQECLEGRSGSHIWEDHFYPEIVDPDSGEPRAEGQEGVLVLTTLTKQAMPLLRYWTGDITSLSSDPCPCGRTHVRMAPVRGRSDDMLIVRGVNFYPSRVEELLAEFHNLGPHHQLRLTREDSHDHVMLRVEPRLAHLSDGDREALAQRLKSRMKSAIGLTFRIEVTEPGQIPRSKGGKLSRVDDRRKAE